MKLKVFGKIRLTGEGQKVTHRITNGSGGRQAALRPFVKGLADICGLSLMVVLAWGVTSCSTMGTHTTQYASAPPLPPTTPTHVKILWTQPTSYYEEIGKIVVNASTQPTPTLDKFEETIRLEAAKLGADAAVVLVDRAQPEGLVGDLPPSDYYLVGEYWTRSVDTISGRQIVAVAIKYGSLPMTGRTQ